MLPDQRTHDDVKVPLCIAHIPIESSQIKLRYFIHTHGSGMTHASGQSASGQVLELELSRCGQCFIAFVSNRQEQRTIPKISCNQDMVQGVSGSLNNMLGKYVAGVGLTYVGR